MGKCSYAKFREMLNEKQNRVKGLKQTDFGLTCYLGGELSPGCLACKTGSWLCVFVTKRCNAVCDFCSQPKPNFEESRSQPENPDEALTIGSDICVDVHTYEFALNLQKDKISGISFTGGEPFLVFDKMLKLIRISRKIRPEAYMWVYTNGKLVTEEAVKTLREEGVSEIRFNWAGSNFDDEIIESMRIAGRHMDRVAIEVPMYHQKVLDTLLPKLPGAVEAGVTHFNAAELDINKNNGPRLQIPEEQVYRHPEYGIVSPYWSRLLTYDLMEYVEKEGLPLTVNDCSNDAKSVQKLTRAANVIKI